ncbi:MAG: flavodoxin family protein [Synergistaceae bacterium]|nr:flavodoxin family protein [Synergistaceae bacterium]
MKVIAVNGSPRKNGNTAILLKKALEGAESKGAETRLVHLYDLNFKGCISCFACKVKNSSCGGLCAIRDDLTSVLKDILECDSLLLGSPIYLSNVTGEMRSFIERLIFPNLSYNKGKLSILQRKIASCFIYTMNITEEMAKEWGYEPLFEQNKSILERILNGSSDFLLSFDTYQFDDYSKYDASNFDEAHKAKVREDQFPVDCSKAFEIGADLAKN